MVNKLMWSSRMKKLIQNSMPSHKADVSTCEPVTNILVELGHGEDVRTSGFS